MARAGGSSSARAPGTPGLPRLPRAIRPRKAMASPVRVVIVTSDGYEAWGRALDPVGAATDYMLVDAFTRFLEKRVATQNMVLLRRMMAEYFCHCETTVREFVAQCSTQISVGPFDAEDPDDVAAAERLLRQQRSFVRSGLSASVFTFLVVKLRTARVSLLMQFFVEFCQGVDTALREFIEKREGFVSILPLAAPQLEHPAFAPSDGIPFESVDPSPMPPPPVFDSTMPRNQVITKSSKPKIQHARKKRKLMTQTQYDDLLRDDFLHYADGEGDGQEAKTLETIGTSDSDADDGRRMDDSALDDSALDDSAFDSDSDQPNPKAFTTSFNHPDEAIYKVKTKLVIDMREFEKLVPWTKVFPSGVALPFDGTTIPDLAQMFREFWRRHARAVWERNFWTPLRVKLDDEEITHRRSRQRNAVIAFERLVVACCERFGAKFFYKLDRKRHPGWWYRHACVDLLGLSAIVGYDKCIEYIEAQQSTRFPDCGHPLPLRSANVGVIQRQQATQVSKSLWLQTAKPEIQAIKDKFVVYVAKKDKKNHQKKAGKKLTGKKAPACEKATKRPKLHLVNVAAPFNGKRKADKATGKISIAAQEEEDKDEKGRGAAAVDVSTATSFDGEEGEAA